MDIIRQQNAMLNKPVARQDDTFDSLSPIKAQKVPAHSVALDLSRFSFLKMHIPVQDESIDLS